jgi:hypothetical protein
MNKRLSHIRDAIGIVSLFGYLYLLGVLCVLAGDLINYPIVGIIALVCLGLILTIFWFRRALFWASASWTSTILVLLFPWGLLALAVLLRK